MTAREISACLMGARMARNFAIPNYTPRQWWECDVFEVTPAGFFREYEIKLTRADFKADAEKRNVQESWGQFDGEMMAGRHSVYPPETKHGLLRDRSPRGPSRFWYVTPKGLLTDGMLPEWAGLIEMSDNTGRTNLVEREIHKAPQLHREPIDAKVYEHARGVCYWRYHKAMSDLSKLHRAHEKFKASKTGIPF